MSDLSWLNPTPQAIAAYASQPPSPVTTQHSLPSGRYSLLGPDFHRLDRTSLPGARSGRDARFIARPPHRTVRAAFPHTAPTSGDWRQSETFAALRTRASAWDTLSRLCVRR